MLNEVSDQPLQIEARLEKQTRFKILLIYASKHNTSV